MIMELECFEVLFFVFFKELAYLCFDYSTNMQLLHTFMNKHVYKHINLDNVFMQ